MSVIEVNVGDQVYADEGGDPFGAVRKVHAHELVVFVEGTGDLSVPAAAVASAHDGKVVLDPAAIGPELRSAIDGAHRAERPGL